MADTTEHGLGHTTGGISRAIAAPVRAVTRIFTPSASTAAGRARAAPATPWSTAASTSTASGSRASGDYAQALAAAAQKRDRRVRLARPARADRGRPGGDRRRLRAGRRSRSRTPSRAGSDPSSSRTATGPSWSSAPRGTCEHAEITENSEIVETGDLMMFIGPQLRHHGAARRAERARPDPGRPRQPAGPARARPVGGRLLDPRPGRRHVRRGGRPGRGGHRRRRVAASSPGRCTAGSPASTSSSASWSSSSGA